jgi:DNA (cytosine-5)-methyltransferase 1
MEDPRGNLTLTFLGLADKLKPRWIVFENVCGLLSSNGGKDFGSFLGALVELGYGFAYRVLDAQHFGVPQRRRRVFVVACLGDWRAPAEVLLEPDCVRRDIKKGRAKGKGVAASAEGGAGASGPAGGSSWWDGGQVSQTLDAVLSKGQTMPEKNRFPAVLQPIGVDFRHTRFEKDGTVGTIQSKSTGGYSLKYAPGVAIPYRKSKRACSTTDNETWVEGDTSNTLNNFDLGDTLLAQAIPIQDGREMEKNQNGMGVGNPGDPAYTIDTTGAQAAAVPFRKSKRACSTTDNERVECEAFIVKASELRLRGQITEKDVCPTLTAGAKQGDTDPLAVHPIAFQPGNLMRKAGADPSTETFPTLTKDSGDQSPHVAHPVVPLDDMNLLSRLGACGDNHSIQNFTPGDPMFTLKKGGTQHGVITPMAVRRLTPIECERLQGFPDNWSRISWKGKPEDQCPDGPRYKACGNSMAVPVMRWIGERIAAVNSKL